MGTISDKLMRIINTKEDIRRALISKGYDVPTSIPFKEYAKMILDLPCNADSFPDIEGIVARYSALGLTNEQMAENPVWKDLTGNGHDLQMKNFAWKGMSGVGGYGDENYQTFYKFTLDDYVFIASPPGVKHMNFTFRVTGLQPGNKLTLAFFGTTNTVYGRWDKDGIYTVDADIVEAGKPTYFYNGYGATRGEFTIEILPLYPGFILGDGVDDFAVTEKELNFEDTYTVYTAFIPFQNNPTRNMILCGADSKKTFSMQYSSLVYVSFIAGNNYYISADFVNGLNLFACKRNGNNICIKNLLTNKVVTGTCGDWVENAGLYYLWKNATYASFAKAAIAGQTICNGYFSTDEDDEKVLDWYKKQYPWLFPDQAWTVVGKTNEDEDRATIANITGNGNNLVLSNFGFAEGSGYGLYNIQKFTNWNRVADRGDIVKNGYSVTITNSKITGSSTNYNTDILYSYNSSSTTIIFKVTGLVDGQKIFLGRKSVTDAYVIDKDGIYRSDYNIPQEGGKVIVGIGTVGFTGECNITIEQIPEYEGYLITDGVDDKVQSSSFTMNEDWTIVGDWELLSNVQINCGIVKAQNVYLYNTANGLLISINNPRSLQSFGTKSLHAICSDGRLYDRNWVEYEYTVDQNFEIVESSLNIGFNLNNYTQIAFKNLGIYNNQILSKDDCIKAYNYLQTLKSK
mgnify:CR=1 FL=1|jgi:hypothetical protein